MHIAPLFCAPPPQFCHKFDLDVGWNCLGGGIQYLATDHDGAFLNKLYLGGWGIHVEVGGLGMFFGIFWRCLWYILAGCGGFLVQSAGFLATTPRCGVFGTPPPQLQEEPCVRTIVVLFLPPPTIKTEYCNPPPPLFWGPSFPESAQQVS